MRAYFLIGLEVLTALVMACPALGADDPAVVERLRAFEAAKDSLEREAKKYTEIKTDTVTVTGNTDVKDILAFIPAKDPGGDTSPRGGTPKSLEGVFWMRGNPLSDYLLSFANFHWRKVGATPYGFLATFAPGSFAWKERIVAQGAKPDDYRYVPEICRVPKDDKVLGQIAHLKSAHDSSTFRRSVAIDLAEIGKPGSTDGVTDADANKFVDAVWTSGQLPELDGAKLVSILAKEHFFYEGKFNADYTEATVTLFKLFTFPTTAAIEVAPFFATFSLAPHPADKNIYVRKSFVKGASTLPNYYWLTRVIDGDGKPTAYYKDFLQCVQERSDGRIVKVEKN